MRPRHLAIQAFGPFTGRVEIDFTGFGTSTLFLIHGPTGAGKSSILDALAFALYGESSGGERLPRDIRSHFAGPDEPTEVELELDAGGGRYRVRRRPEQELLKQRGDGTTIRKPEAELERWEAAADRWRLVAAGTRDVDTEVVRIVGVEAAHFRQVVVLPQGQFRRLLTADSVHREQILATLFETARYERVQDELRRRALELRRTIADAETRQQALLGEHDAAEEAELVALADALAEQEATLTAALDTARGEEVRCGAARDTAREAAARLAAVAEAVRAVAALEARREAMDATREALASDARAASLADLLGDVEHRREDVAERDRAADQLTAASRAADDQEHARRAALAAEEARSTERAAARREAERLAGLVAARDALEIAERTLRDAAAAATAARTRRDDLQRALTTLDDDLTDFDRRLEHARSDVSRGEAAELERHRIEAAISAAVRRQEAVAEASRLADELARATHDRDQATAGIAAQESRLAAARTAASQAQAAHLASTLVDGEPCPVCGSAHHPSPAAATAELPDPAAIETLERELAAARRRGERSGRRVAELDGARRAAVARAEAAVEALGDLADASRDGLEARRAAAVAALERARSGATRLEEAARGRRQLEEQRARTAAELATAEAAARDADATTAAAAAVAEERRRALPVELRDLGALRTAIEAAEARHEQLNQALVTARSELETATTEAATLRERLTAARTELAAARAQLERRTAALTVRLHDAGFADEDQLRAARLEGAERASHAAELATWERAIAAATANLARAREQAADTVEPDLAAVETAYAAARAATERLAAERGTIHARREHARRTLASLADLAAGIAAADADHGVVGELAEVATDRSMPFSRYVVAAMLDEVLLEASRRLAAMSRGRFSLRRDADPRDRRRAGGLDLAVFDAHTGLERPVETLSGGEGFLASLSLALGLADVVQRHSGGVRLDTVFIDEGFGSLDPEALDLAWQTLLDLHAEGRLVGVISHVPDLKERIPAAIEVVPGPHGATVTTRTA